MSIIFHLLKKILKKLIQLIFLMKIRRENIILNFGFQFAIN
mgnify:CR=1 FL=1